MIRLLAGGPRIRGSIVVGATVFSFSEVFRLALGHTQRPVRQALWLFYLGVKLQEREAD